VRREQAGLEPGTVPSPRGALHCIQQYIYIILYYIIYNVINISSDLHCRTTRGGAHMSIKLEQWSVGREWDRLLSGCGLLVLVGRDGDTRMRLARGGPPSGPTERFLFRIAKGGS
jgi:hypothetical protein